MIVYIWFDVCCTLIINPIYTLYSGYLLGISPFKGLCGVLKQLGVASFFEAPRNLGKFSPSHPRYPKRSLANGARRITPPRCRNMCPGTSYCLVEGEFGRYVFITFYIYICCLILHCKCYVHTYIIYYFEKYHFIFEDMFIYLYIGTIDD